MDHTWERRGHIPSVTAAYHSQHQDLEVRVGHHTCVVAGAYGPAVGDVELKMIRAVDRECEMGGL